MRNVVTHHFCTVCTHHLSQTTWSHTTLCHTPGSLGTCGTVLAHNFATSIFFRHNFVTHTQLCHTPSFADIFVTHNVVTHLFSHNFVTHTHNPSQTTLPHRIFHTQLCHRQLCHTHTSNITREIQLYIFGDLSILHHILRLSFLYLPFPSRFNLILLIGRS